METQESTNTEILHAVRQLGERVEKVENTNTEILQAINNYATHNEQRLDTIESEISGMKSEMGSMKSEMGSMKALMVTKDYLDDKLADLKGDIITVVRKEDTKFKTLVEILAKRNLISPDEVKTILSMQPFPQMFV